MNSIFHGNPAQLPAGTGSTLPARVSPGEVGTVVPTAAAGAAGWPWQELVLASFCLWQASDLVISWRHSPFDRLGWLSFLIWSIPAIQTIASVTRRCKGSALFTAFALFTVLIGRILDVNALLCGALALSLAGLASPRSGRLLWLVGALAWMPALGWFCRGLPVWSVCALRLTLATAATLAFFLSPKNKVIS